MIVRPATSDDAPAIADVLYTTRAISLPFLPILHTPEEFADFVSGRLMPQSTEVWVVEMEGGVAGVIAIRDDWIDQLYVRPEHQGQGLGKRLLAKALQTGRPLQLWAFQENDRAGRFYEAHGFRAAEFTQGEGNEEKTPDVRYVRP